MAVRIDIGGMNGLRAPMRLPLARASDEALARRVRGGDERSFEELYSRYRDHLFQYCASILHHPEDAEEALQSAMLNAYWSLARPQRRDLSVRAWLYRIAHNECVTMLRRRPPRASQPLTGLEALPGQTVAERIETAQELSQLRQDLLALPREQRSALVLREMSGFSHAQIAQILGDTPAAVKQLIYQARSGLHAMAHGRTLDCEAVQRSISAGDGRVLRSRGIGAHLRVCASCRSFRDAIATRPRSLAALAPVLPVLAGRRLLSALRDLTGAGAVGGGAGGVTGGAGAGAAIADVLAGIGSGLASKMAVVTVTAALVAPTISPAGPDVLSDAYVVGMVPASPVLAATGRGAAAVPPDPSGAAAGFAPVVRTGGADAAGTVVSPVAPPAAGTVASPAAPPAAAGAPAPVATTGDAAPAPGSGGAAPHPSGGPRPGSPGAAGGAAGAAPVGTWPPTADPGPTVAPDPGARDGPGPPDWSSRPAVPGQPDRAGPPDHAGPPEHAGPPDHAGPPGHAGPPDHAGPPENAGPPDHAGPPENAGRPADAGPPDHREGSEQGPAPAAQTRADAADDAPGRTPGPPDDPPGQRRGGGGLGAAASGAPGAPGEAGEPAQPVNMPTPRRG